MSEELTVSGAGKYNLQSLRRRDELTEAQIGFNVVHDIERRHGTYRPIRNLPILYKKGNITDSEGYVWSQGKILGKYDRRIYTGGAWKYQDDAKKLGINDIATGEFYGYINRDSGSAEKVDFNDSDWGNSEDVTGLLGPMNGMDADIQDPYDSNDAGFRAINPVTGDLINSTYISTNPDASLRALGDPVNSTFELCGVAFEDAMRETRSNNYQYKRMTEAFAVAKRGYLTLPFVIADGGTLTITLDASTPASSAAILASEQRGVSADQTILWVESADLLQTGNVVKVDGWGNPILASNTSTQFVMEFGTLVDFTHAIRVPYAKWVNTYPEMEIAGTGTAGLAHDIFYAARKMAANTSKTVEDLAEDIEGSDLFGYATIYFDIP